MITVIPGQYVRCNTIGDPKSSGHVGVFEYVMNSPEDISRGWGPDYGMVDGIPCNLHNCIPWSSFMPTVTPLSMEIILNGNTRDYSAREVMAILTEEGYTHLGWLNAGIVPPRLNDWTEVYKNRSGSHCIYASPSTRLIYSVDMGD
jgi:hypothetical protein